MKKVAYTMVCLIAALLTDMSVAAIKKGPVKAPPARTAAAKPAAKKAPARKASRSAAQPVANPYRQEPYVGALAIDAKTGRILFADGADRPARPASVTKLMTALLVLEDIEAGRYGLDTPVGAGPMALRMEPSVIGFFDGKPPQPVKWSVDTLLHALMIRSANDAAVALAAGMAADACAWEVPGGWEVRITEQGAVRRTPGSTIPGNRSMCQPAVTRRSSRARLSSTIRNCLGTRLGKPGRCPMGRRSSTTTM